MSSMSEIYWITRLDYIRGLAVAGLIISVLLLIAWLASLPFDDELMARIRKTSFRWALPVLLISSSILTFIPTAKEMLLIFAAGGSWDYIPNNYAIRIYEDAE